MRSKKWILIFLVLVMAFLAGCGAKTQAGPAFSGEYVAVDPPTDAGENEIIRALVFEKDQVILKSDNLEKTLPYNIAEGKINFETALGKLTYSFAETEGGFILDGVTYQKGN